MKKILKTTLVAFVVYKILDFVIHGFLLGSFYEKFADIYRIDMNDYMWVFFVGPFVVWFLLTFIFSSIRKEKRCMFKIIMPFVIMIPAAFYTWASIDISLSFTVWWFFAGLIQSFIVLFIIEKMYGSCICKHCKAVPAEEKTSH